MQFKTRLIIAILLGSSLAGFSQKQSDNLPAPDKVKIDGNISEWTAPFQINKPTKLSYIIANDAKNLYLVIQSEDSLVNSRILLTGIDFMVNQAGKKKEGPFVMFPVVPRAPGRGAQGMQGMQGMQAAVPFVPVAELVVAHRKVLADIKEIKVSGFKEITDETISIYNEFGIKGAGSFNDKDFFLYELSIPLSLLGLTAESGQEVAYNIKINGSEGQNLRAAGGGGGFGGGGDGGRGGGGDGGRGGGGFGGGGGGFGGGFETGGGGGGAGRGGNGNNANRGNQNRFYEPTDFWINYKLTKPKS